MPLSDKTVVVIAGPTAVGKTAVSLALARHFDTEIISADSRQCYREMNIGVARPSAEELAAVPHHFIASHSIQEKVTAASFEQYALAAAARIFQRRKVLVMVGGTGLYIKAFCEGLDAIPEVPEQIRRAVIEEYGQKGLTWLQEAIRLHDPLFWQRGETKNPQRLMRALEVVQATGRSVLSFRSGEKKDRPFQLKKIALTQPRDLLYQTINERVDRMLAAGLLEEVASLLPWQHLNALQTVGYKELFDYLNGEASLPAAVEAIKQNTRHYAKRQLTWFRRDAGYQWVEPDAAAIIRLLSHDEAGGTGR